MQRMSVDELWDFCQANPDLRIELTANGELEVRGGFGLENGWRSADLKARVGEWAKRNRVGVALSNAGFILPNGAVRGPLASWVARSRLAGLTRAQKQKFGPLSPDFVIELMSPSDRLNKQQAKMREYIENGVALGWLLDPEKRAAYIYRPGRDLERLDAPPQLVGEGPVTGFVLELKEIWETDL